MKLIIPIFFFISSAFAGGPICRDKICPGQCLRPSDPSLYSCNREFSLVVGEFEVIYFVQNNNQRILKAFFNPKTYPCSQEICVEESGRVVVNSCDTYVYMLDPVVAGGCVQAGDDGTLFYIDQSGRRIKGVFEGPIPSHIG
jgi:hypothetical protein